MTNEQETQKLNQLEQENIRLRNQVKLLMAGENKLYVLQDHLNAQQRIYVRLAEIGRELNVSLDTEQILKDVVHFVLYEFNYERCAIFLEDTSSEPKVYRVRAFEGYYEEPEAAHISAALLTGNEPALENTYGESGVFCHNEENRSESSDALGSVFLMDEYFVFALKRKGKGVNGFIAAGNTKEQARYQTSVEAGGEMLTAFSNLAGQTAITLANVQAYTALQEERHLLDRMVDERTRELSEALDAAHEAVRVKAEFLAKISHELRTPLNSIVNIPGALAEEYEDVEIYVCESCNSNFQSDEEEEEEQTCPECGGALHKTREVLCTGSPAEHLKFIKLLRQQGIHLLNVVEDVLDFSKLDSGRMEINHTIVDIGLLLEEIAPAMDAAMMGKPRIVRYPALDPPITIEADRLRLKQIFINLIANAVKFTPEGKEITVSVSEENNNGVPSVLFSVADQGIGIPKEQLEMIFESFRQVDGSHTRSFGGTGLGLAISRQLVEMHGGEIWVTSTLGEGSTFSFRLPKFSRAVSSEERARQSSIPAAVTTKPSGAQRGHGTVVVVDDEPAQLSMARKFLEKEGYAVVLVSDPKSAVEVIAANRPRFVILDIMMPEMSGLQLLEQIRQDEQLKMLPVIASTAFHYNRKRIEEADAHWLPKPWNRDNLSAANLEAVISSYTSIPEEKHDKKHRVTDLVSKILYVEDEDANYEVTALSLRGKYHLERAKDSKEAFELLSKSTYDIILMDIQLAGSDLNGIEICEVLTGRRESDIPEYARGIQVKCPIVVVTAYTSLYAKEDLLAAGAAGFVSKPVDFAHLLIVLSRLMVSGAMSDLKRG